MSRFRNPFHNGIAKACHQYLQSQLGFGRLKIMTALCFRYSIVTVLNPDDIAIVQRVGFFNKAVGGLRLFCINRFSMPRNYPLPAGKAGVFWQNCTGRRSSFALFTPIGKDSGNIGLRWCSSIGFWRHICRIFLICCLAGERKKKRPLPPMYGFTEIVPGKKTVIGV